MLPYATTWPATPGGPDERKRATSTTLSLIGSLIFAVGQLAVGGWLARRGVRGGRWRQVRNLGGNITMLAGMWFVASGVIELFVSGMEVSQRLWRVPSPATFATWRGRGDGLLFAITIAVLLAAAVYLILWRIADRRAGDT